MNGHENKSNTIKFLIRSIYFTAIICMILFCPLYISSASDKSNENTNDTHLSQGIEEDVNGITNYSFSLSNSTTPNQVDKEKFISGIGYGELLLTVTINKVLPVFSGRYSCDIAGIHVPPISTDFQVDAAEKTGYGYDLPNIEIPGKPNNFTVSVAGAKTLSVGLRKLQGSYKNADAVWEARYTRTWISNQAGADEDGNARLDSDLLSPGIYHAKIFGDAAENASQINLNMTVVKKLIVDGPYLLGINTTAFPEGEYSFKLKALNGSFRIDEMLMEM